MKPFAAILLRSLLAVALVGGGLSSWTMGASAMSMSASSPAAMHSHGETVGPCHHLAGQDADDSLTLAASIDHCADSDECQYPSCNHLCTSAGLAVPVRAHSSARPPATCPPVAFVAPSPHNLTSPPQRPPRA